jgi:hypothetical protein
LGANYYLWGEDAFSFHVVNFLIHSLNALLVFRIFSTLLTKADPQRHTTEVWLLSSLAAALWSVNPVHTQPVVYIVQRMTLLSSLFSLLSFYLFVQWRSGARKWYAVLSRVRGFSRREQGKRLPSAFSFLAYEWLFTDRRFFDKEWPRPHYFHVWLDSPSRYDSSIK